MSNNGIDKSNKEKSWLHSDIYDRPSSVKNPIPRKSIFKFGSFRDVISNFGKWIAQITLYTMIFPVLSILLWPGPSGWGGDQIYLVIAEIVKLVSFTISVFIIVKFFDDSEIVEIGLKFDRRATSHFFAGVIIVVLVLALNFLLFWGVGLIEIQTVAWQTRTIGNIILNVLILFVVFSFTGWSEELLSRGFHLRIISKGVNRPLGVLLSSVLFSYMHHNVPDIRPGDYVFIFLFGIIMCIAFLRTGQLWLAIGLHAGWDFFGSILGLARISDLKLFQLFDTKFVYHPIIYFFFEVLDLIVILFIIRMYTSKYKVEILDW